MIHNISRFIAALALLAIAQGAWAWSGSGTAESPYQIKSTADLDQLASDVNGGTEHEGVYFVLTTDLTYSHTTDWNDANSTENNYTPIGGYNNKIRYFKGHFDGQSHTISGIRIYQSGSEAEKRYAALFGFIDGAEVKNVFLADARFTGYTYCGPIVGYNRNGRVENCHVLSDVTVHAVTTDADYHGGVVGYNAGTITGCTSAATISGDVSCEEHGGIVGSNNGTVEDCIYFGNTVEATKKVGAICGDVLGNGTVRNCYYTSTNFTGKNSSGTALTNDASAIGYIVSGSTVEDARQATSDDFAVSGDTYTIGTAAGWSVMCAALYHNDTYNRFSGKTVRLDADIAVTRMAGSDHHDFCGTFDGGGNTITLDGNTTNGCYALFRNVSTGRANPGDEADTPSAIRNLHVDGTITTASKYAAGFISGMWGTVNISNCISSVTIRSSVSGDGTHGGFVAASNGTANISGCVFDGKIITTGGTTHCAGFVGYGTCTITDCLYAPAALADGETEVQPGDGETPGATFCRNGATITNSYYIRALGTAQGKATRTVAAAADVTIDAIALTGTAIQYTVSGITAYSGGGLQRGQTLYYGSDDQLSLTLSNSATGAPLGYQYGYTASAGTLSGTTLTMPDEDVTITAALAPIDWATVNQGDSEDPYMIYNKDQLLLLAHRVNGTNGETVVEEGYLRKYFKLGADITFSHPDNEGDNYAENYEAIGTNDRFFCGNFDGDGHTVSGIRIRKTGSGPANSNQGLFGCIAPGANIHDVHLTDARITGNYCVGGIVSYNGEGYIMRCSVTDSYITAVGEYGTICGINEGTLTNNYYHGCTVNGTENATNVGCSILADIADITANNGALPAYRLALGANITTPPGTFAGQTVWLDTPPVSPRLAPENGFTLAGNHYFASGYVFTPGSTLASGAAQGYTPRATLGDQLLDLYTPTGNADPLAGKAIARLTITADCDGKTLASTQAIYSTRQSVTVAYIKADGTPGEASAIALDGHETVAKDGDIHLAAGTYYVGTDIAYANQIVSDGNITLILANGKTMTLNGNTTGIAIGYNLTIYGQSLDDATAGTLRYNGTWEGIHAYYYEQHSGNVSITTTGSGVFGINADVTLRGGTLTVTADGTDACAIYGYTLSILGGQLTATATGDNATGIYASANDGTAITLGWTRPADRITASSISTGGGTVAVADGKKLHNGSGYLSGYLSDPATALNGKTLRPAATATYTTADGTAATADAILLDASDNSLPAGNYLATGTLNYTHGITLAGDVTLILADNCHMNVGTSGERIEDTGIFGFSGGSHSITITSQSLGDDMGALSVYTTGMNKFGILANAITIDGGNVTADTDGRAAVALYAGGTDLTINGGTVTATTAGTDAHAIYAIGDFKYNGGDVTATATAANANAIRAAGGNYTFSWRTPADRITIGATGLYAPAAKTATFTCLFTDATNIYSGTLTGDDLSTLAGKTLYPYIETLDLAANKAPDQNYWTTFYCGHTDYQIDANENACAYTATYADGKLTLHRLGKAVPKGTAVIIVADNGVVSMTAATVLPAFSGTNDLRGVNVDTPVANITSDLGEGTLYVLGMTTVNNEQHFGFHHYTGEEMAARKAFLHVPGSSNARALDMVFGDITGIAEMRNEEGEMRNGNEEMRNAWYTLDGRKLNGKPTKPGLYINNGRKVVIQLSEVDK